MLVEPIGKLPDLPAAIVFLDIWRSVVPPEAAELCSDTASLAVLASIVWESQPKRLREASATTSPAAAASCQ